MPPNAVTGRTEPDPICTDDETLGLSVCAPNGDSSTPSSSAPDATSPASYASSPAVQSLVSKFSSAPAPLTPSEPDTSGCGRVQDCAGADGRPVLEGQNACGPDAQFSLTARRFAPFDKFGFGFDGDAASRGITTAEMGHGGFSASPSATSRTSMTLTVDGGSITPEAHADPSHHDRLGTDRARVGVANASTLASTTDGMLDARFAGANPLVSHAPDIDTDLQVAYRSDTQALSLDATVWGDRFPKGEVLVSDNAQNHLLLATFQTDGSRNGGPFTLMLDASRADGSKFELMQFQARIPLDPSGNFAASPVVIK